MKCENTMTVCLVQRRREIEGRLAAEELTLSEDEYWEAHSALVAQGLLIKGQRRGGSVRRPIQAAKDPNATTELAPSLWLHECLLSRTGAYSQRTSNSKTPKDGR